MLCICHTLQILGLRRRQEEPMKGKGVWIESRRHRFYFTNFCESSASVLEHVKHNERAKSILSHAKWFIYFTVFDLRSVTVREHVLITKSCPKCHRLYNDLSLCCWKMFLFTTDLMMYQLLHPKPLSSKEKKTLEPHFLKTGTWCIMSNSRWPCNHSCWGERNISFTLKF